MNNQLEKLNERLDFYMKAYEETSEMVKQLNNEKKDIENEIQIEAMNILNETVENPLLDEHLDALEKEYQMNLDDIVADFEKKKLSDASEIKSLKEDSRYKEYLGILINDDLKMVVQMEKDEVFEYLVEQNFGTDGFVNEPIVKILGFKFQPRYWKFKSIADKKAKEFGMSSYAEMLELWNGLRVNFKSLIGNKTIKEILTECESIETKIKQLEEAILNYLTPRREAVINAMIERIKMNNDTVRNNLKFTNLLPLLESFKNKSEQFMSSDARRTSIMDNIGIVEGMIGMMNEGKLTLSDQSNAEFFANTNPETSITEMVSNSEWESIKKMLDKKGIATSSKENYTVVRNKISEQSKKEYLEKYNVAEGEIFIDENLAKVKNKE